MIEKFVKNWNERKDLLKKEIEKLSVAKLEYGSYGTLMGLILENVFSGVDSHSLRDIDYGDYQGTLIFVYCEETYQPSSYETYYTIVEYGSCSGCDTLLHITSCYTDYDTDRLTEKGVEMIMSLCLDMVENTYAFKELL